MIFTELSDRDFRRFSVLVYEKCGINLHDGKKELVRARLSKRLREGNFRDFKNYYRFVAEDESGDELVRMLDAISTNQTSFFREKKHFDFLKETVFPSYVVEKRNSRKLRFWSAGCSSGEEPYSLTIWLLEYFNENLPFDVKILATDISTKVLALAQRGVYTSKRLANMPILFPRKYFQQGYDSQKGNVRVKQSLRELIEFRRFNLMAPFPFKEVFNVIFCRNVMIYFDKKTQQALVDKFYESLSHGGYLFVGHSESLTGIRRKFEYVMPSIYRKRG